MSSPASDGEQTSPLLGRRSNDKRLSGHGEVWNSFGFVEVGEQRVEEGELGGYPMKRTKSSLFHEDIDEHAFQNYKLLDNRLSLLQRELVTMKRKMDVFEEDKSKTNQWGVKYTRTSLIKTFTLTCYYFHTECSTQRFQSSSIIGLFQT